AFPKTAAETDKREFCKSLTYCTGLDWLQSVAAFTRYANDNAQLGNPSYRLSPEFSNFLNNAPYYSTYVGFDKNRWTFDTATDAISLLTGDHDDFYNIHNRKNSVRRKQGVTAVDPQVEQTQSQGL
ncbi:unnamed protein product, partial [Didymodactylos carnosus]